MLLEQRRHKLKQIRAKARPRPLDKVRAGLICLGIALVLFYTMGRLAGISTAVGLVACIAIFAIVRQADPYRDEDVSDDPPSSGNEHS